MDDEKTLKIKVVYGSDSDRKPPAQPPSPPRLPSPPPSQLAPRGSSDLVAPGRDLVPQGRDLVPRSRIVSSTVTTNPPAGRQLLLQGPPQAPPNTPPPQAPPPNQPPPQAPPQAPPRQAPPQAPPIGLPPTPPRMATPGGAPPGPPTPPTPRVPAGAGATPIAGGGGAIAGLMRVLGPATIAVGAVITAFGALVTATTLITGAFARMSERLGQYDPGIAVAEGISEMRRIQSDIKAARERSTEIQTITKKRTDIDVTMNEIGTTLTKTFTPMLARILAIMEIILKAGEWAIKLVNKAWDELTDLAAHPGKNPTMFALLSPLITMVGIINGVGKLLDKWLNIQLNEDQDASKFQQDIIDALNPHRSDLRDQVNRNERGRTPRGVRL